MSTVREVWGFGEVLSVEVDVADFCRAMNRAATERGIAPNVPSDALDLSRDVMLDEAAASLGADWSITPDGTLRLWRRDLIIKWDSVAQVAGR